MSRRQDLWRNRLHAAPAAAVAAAFLMGCAESTHAASPQPPADAAVPFGPPPPQPVRAELLADVEAIQPGKPFHLGVLLRMAPGWHVYWKYPGDAGIATRVAFRLPKGFRAGPLRWPVPTTFQQGGDIVGYGYEKAVLLAAEIAPPRTLRPGETVELVAEAGWMACKAVCVVGEATVRLELPAAKSPRPANAAVFADWRARLPVAAKEAPGLAGVTVSGAIRPPETSGRFAILLQWDRRPERIEWYPAAGADLAVEKASVRTNGAETRVAFTATFLTGTRLASAELETLVAYSDGKGGRRAVIVPVPLTPAKRPASSKPAKRPDSASPPQAGEQKARNRS
jgi:DsbC/DsbD-like thiol-disulfide interchange protein